MRQRSKVRLGTVRLGAGLLLIMLGGIAACGDDGGGATVVRLSDADNAAKPQLSVGDTLIVSLVSNASTGFSWKVEIASPRLKLTRERYDEPKSPSGLVGAAGTQVFEFEAVSAGTGPPLQLAYKRSTGPADKVWEITPTVR